MIGHRIIALFVLSLAVSQGARAEETEYKAEFFSYDGPLRTGASSHTFARFTKLEAGKVTETVDISWLPEPGNFRRGNRMPLLRTVPGHNYTVEETMRIAGGKPVLTHGSYFTTADIFQGAVLRKAELESGRIAYKMLDNRSGDNAINCIHAVTGVLGRLNTGLLRGETATNEVVSFFLSSGRMSSRRIARPAVSAPSVLAETPSHGAGPGTVTGGGRPVGSPRYYSADTKSWYSPISENTTSVGGSPVPAGRVRPLGWRLGGSGEIIWVFGSESDFPG